MACSRLIVCEKTGRWAAALRRALGRRHRLLRETRSLDECGRELAAARASVVALEVTPDNWPAVVSSVLDWTRRFPRCRVMALVEEPLAAAEPLVREAGAIAAATSTRQARSIARLALKHLARLPADDAPLETAILEDLPWGNWATQPTPA